MDPLTFSMGFGACALVLWAGEWVNGRIERALRIRAARHRCSELVA